MAGLVILAVFVAACAIGAGRVWLRRRPEAPLRREIRSQPVTFRIVLDEVKEKQSDAWWGWFSHRAMILYVRSDAFQLTPAILPIRGVEEFLLKARQTTIKVNRGPFVLNFIVVTGRREGKEIQLALMHRTRIHEVWDALVRAGAVPIGPPPLHRYEARPKLFRLAMADRCAADQGIPAPPAHCELCVRSSSGNRWVARPR